MLYEMKIIKLLTLVVLMSAGYSASAYEQDLGQYAVVYLDAHGQSLIDQSNQSGSPSSGKHKFSDKTFRAAAQNNVCASLVLTHQFEAAKRSCNAAVKIGAETVRNCGNSGACPSESSVMAKVHSNRGVVFALMGSAASAEASFTEALRLDPQCGVAARNLITMSATRMAANTAAME